MLQKIVSCLQENYEIQNYLNQEVSLNKRSELMSKCHYGNKKMNFIMQIKWRFYTSDNQIISLFFESNLLQTYLVVLCNIIYLIIVIVDET